MGKMSDARKALEKAIDDIAKLHADEERLLQALKPFEDAPQAPVGQKAVVASNLMKQLVEVQKKLQVATAAHDKAIKDMAAAFKEKHG